MPIDSGQVCFHSRMHTCLAVQPHACMVFYCHMLVASGPELALPSGSVYEHFSAQTFLTDGAGSSNIASTIV